MAQDTARASAKVATFKPRLSELRAIGRGRYRLHWHGGISPGKLQFPLNYKVDVQFVGVDDPTHVKTVTVTLGAFPHLAIGTVWRDGIYDGHIDHQIERFDVNLSCRLEFRVSR